MLFDRRGQTYVEYLTILGAAAVLIGPFILLFEILTGKLQGIITQIQGIPSGGGGW
jgi:hypothetical protein